jgi:putative FmdB family regulatory protein
MPLFDFRCRACAHEFEALVRPQDAGGPRCPACQGADLERLLATFAVSSQEKTRAAASKKRQKEAATARRDNIAMDIEAERHRIEDHS